uniref:Flagellar FliJ protein n=2 Tax=Pandoraea faecigallinarum TaxID=656179 RepID=A0A0H3WSG2_9BURK
MKQLQERELQSLSTQDTRLAEQYAALAAQRDAILALIASSKPSQLGSDITGLRGGMRATSMLRQQARDIDVTLTTLAESREQLATDRELTEHEWRRWWRKETKYSRLAKTLRSDARKRQAHVERGELEERQSWGP